MLTEEEIDEQIDEHYKVNQPDFILEAYENGEEFLCRGASCSIANYHVNDCKKCIGNYILPELIEVQPHLNWKNLKETILMAQVLGIKSQTNK